MEKIENYKNIIDDVFDKHASVKLSYAPDIKHRVIKNEAENSFVLLMHGWEGKKYIHNLLFHIEIIDEKAWIFADNTDIGIADELVEEGIPKSDIVLGFLAPYAREISGFAVA